MILVINKIDTVKKDEILKTSSTPTRMCTGFEEIVPVSALKENEHGHADPDLIFKYLPYGPAVL